MIIDWTGHYIYNSCTDYRSPIHNSKGDYRSRARTLSIIPREIIDEAPIYNSRPHYRLPERALSIIRREIIDEVPIYNIPKIIDQTGPLNL